MKIHLPYGKGKLAFDLPKERIAGVLCNDSMKASADSTADEIVRRSMEQPIGSPRLRELARGRDRVVLIASDHTRPSIT